jgi:cytochrome P450
MILIGAGTECVNKLLYFFWAETLRKYPPAGVIKRECNKEYRVAGTKVRVPVGMTLCVPIYSLHRDPDYYPQPDKFIPERFDDGKPPSVYFPFGKGPRICAGILFQF